MEPHNSGCLQCMYCRTKITNTTIQQTSGRGRLLGPAHGLKNTLHIENKLKNKNFATRMAVAPFSNI